MKERYKLYRRENGMFYAEDTQPNNRERIRLRSRNPELAETKIEAMNNVEVDSDIIILKGE
jgi:hypothetical protein